MTELPKLIATSVVRGSQQGESHGGVYLIDFRNEEIIQTVDWNKGDIDFAGRGWDRGLRGIAFHDEYIYIAASDELFVYDQNFQIQHSFRNRYLKHCHEISVRDDLMLVTSTGYDSLLVFDLKQRSFSRGLHLSRASGGWALGKFDPNSEQGPAPSNELHLNNVTCDQDGVFVSGLHTGVLLHIGGDLQPAEICSLPDGTHNARPWRDGIIFNDTNADAVRYVSKEGADRAFAVPNYAPEDIEFAGIDDSKIARQGFGRGLCPVGESLIAGGSSPSTISLYDLDANEPVAAVNLSMDIRNAVHGLEVWPFG
jgi:hypothetical protein